MVWSESSQFTGLIMFFFLHSIKTHINPMKSTQTSIFLPLVFAASLKKKNQDARPEPDREGEEVCGCNCPVPWKAAACFLERLLEPRAHLVQCLGSSRLGVFPWRQDDSTWSGKRFFPFFPWSMGLSGFNFPEKNDIHWHGMSVGERFVAKMLGKEWKRIDGIVSVDGKLIDL